MAEKKNDVKSEVINEVKETKTFKKEYPVSSEQFFRMKGINIDKGFVNIYSDVFKTLNEWEKFYKDFSKLSIKEIRQLEKEKKDKRK